MPSATMKLSLSGMVPSVSDTVGVAFTESFIHWPMQLATASTDTSVSFGGVTTATLVYIKSDQTLTLNVNSNTGTDITVTANYPLILSGSSVTALYLSNASGSTANIYIIGLGS